jgi:hypothetical protein
MIHTNMKRNSILQKTGMNSCGLFKVISMSKKKKRNKARIQLFSAGPTSEMDTARTGSWCWKSHATTSSFTRYVEMLSLLKQFYRQVADLSPT